MFFIFFVFAGGFATGQSARWSGSLTGIVDSTGSQFSATNPFPTLVPKLAYTLSSSISVGTSSGQLIGAGAVLSKLMVCTLPASTTNVWLNLTGNAAIVGSGAIVYAAGGCTFLGGPALPLPTTAITAVTDGGNAQNITLTGG
jgi:hypothetical protein